jgi:hypothetical protein
MMSDRTRLILTPFEFMDGRFGTALISGLLSKIYPRNCPNQAYVSFITDSGPVLGVGD